MRFIHEALYSQAPELRGHIEIYLDDILIHTPDTDLHKKILEKVCQYLNKFNLGINLSKCVSGKSSLHYLGFKISREGYSATDDKVISPSLNSPPTLLRTFGGPNGVSFVDRLPFLQTLRF